MKVDKSIPIPPKYSEGTGRPPSAEIRCLKANGDSYFIPCYGDEIERRRRLSYLNARTAGFKITTRFRTEDGKPGLRIWRIS